VALTPALELAIGEQGAGVRVSARDRGRSQVHAQRDGGKKVAHLVGVVDVRTYPFASIPVAILRLGVAEAQLAVEVASCSHGLQDK